VEELFGRLAKPENCPRDPAAVIMDACARAVSRCGAGGQSCRLSGSLARGPQWLQSIAGAACFRNR
jgi:hypothetical protein